jgi:hypothetical protein
VSLFCLSSPCILCNQGCQCLCFVLLHPVNKDTGNLDYTRYRVKKNKTKTLVTLITQDTGWRKTKQRHWQPWLHKIQGEEKQNKDTGNLDYTRYRVKTNKTKTLVTLITQDTGWRKTKQRHWQPWLHKIQGEDKQNKDTGNLDYTRYRVKTNKPVSLFCLSSPCILCNQGCQCLCFVCLHPVSCVIKVASVFVLFFFTLYLV